jgi:hypothetical protein
MKGTHPLVAHHLLPFMAQQSETASPPGSACRANAFTSNGDRVLTEAVVGDRRLALPEVANMGHAHATRPSFQALIVPVPPLVLSRGH